jgi:hypothetical protein
VTRQDVGKTRRSLNLNRVEAKLLVPVTLSGQTRPHISLRVGSGAVRSPKHNAKGSHEGVPGRTHLRGEIQVSKARPGPPTQSLEARERDGESWDSTFLDVEY